MKHKTDQLFKQALQDFESIPNQKVWARIQQSQKAIKPTASYQKWLIPFGIVACLVLLYWLYQTPSTNLEPEQKMVKENKIVNDNLTNTGPDSLKLVPYNKAVTNTLKSDKKNQQPLVLPKTNNNKADNSTITRDVVSNDIKSETTTNDSGYKSSENTSVTHNDNTLVTNNPSLNAPDDHVFLDIKKDSIASIALYSPLDNEHPYTKDNSNLKSKTSTSQENNLNKTVTENAELVSETSDTLSLHDIVSTKENPLTNPNTQVELAQLEELLEKENTSDSKQNRWQLSSNVAPIFMGSLSSGSPIGSQFLNNSKSYQTTMSYGVGIQYAINNKLTLRTGINNVQLNLNTNEVLFFTDLQGGVLLNNVSFTNQIDFSNMVIISRYDEAALNNYAFNINSNLGSINQEIGFFEIPMELSYQINEGKKFKVNFIGGISTLFLNHNVVSLKDNQGLMELGSANNINRTHWSTNIGFGFQYLFNKNWSLQSEPMLKYQINAFESSTSFSPFWLGIQTGLNYRF